MGTAFDVYNIRPGTIVSAMYVGEIIVNDEYRDKELVHVFTVGHVPISVEELESSVELIPGEHYSVAVEYQEWITLAGSLISTTPAPHPSPAQKADALRWVVLSTVLLIGIFLFLYLVTYVILKLI